MKDNDKMMEKPGKELETLRRRIVKLEQTETDYKRMNERIGELSYAIEQSPGTIIITDLKGDIEYVNRRFTEISGYTREEVIGKNPRIFKSGKTLPQVYKKMWDTITSGNEWRGAFLNRRKNGELYLESAIIAPIKNPEGVITRFIAAKEDITEHNRAAEELHLLLTMIEAISESQDFQAALQITIGKVCQATGWDYGEAWVPDSDGKILECSPAWYSKADSLEKFRQLSEEFTFPPNTGLPGRVWSSRKPEWRTDVSTEPESVFPRSSSALEAGLKAGYGVPIIANGQVLAILVFFMMAYHEEDKGLVKLISGVAAQLGLVIQRKRDEEELRRHRDHLEKMVEERTIEMIKANIQLREEIAERKWAEEELMTTTQRLQAIFSSTNEAMFTIDMARHITSCNRAAEVMLGYPESELLEHTTARFYPSKKAYLDFGKRLYAALEEKGYFNGEFELKRANGEIFSAEYTLTVLRLEKKQLGLVAIIRDISERRRGEEEIRLLLTLTQAISESRDFRAALKITVRKVCQATGWYYGEAWIPSSDGKILECGPAWYDSVDSLEKFRRLSEEFTFPPNTGLPGRVWSSQEPEWIPDVSAELEKVFPRSSIALEAGLRAGYGVPIIANGQVLAVLVFFMMAYHEEDKGLVKLVSGAATQLGSVIQRKQAEELYETLAESSPVGVYIFQDGQFKYVNPQMQRLTGSTEGEIMGMNPGEFIYPDDREQARQNAVAMLKGKRLHPYEFRVVNRTGGVRWAMETVASIHYKGKRATLGYFLDITDSKKMEEQLQHSQLLASLGEMTAGIAHEVGNPLASILLISELVTQSDIPPQARKDLRTIRNETKRAGKIMRDLLTYSRKLTPHMRRLSLHHILKKVLDMRQYEEKVQNISVSTNLFKDTLYIDGDSSQLTQVFMNLMLNAEEALQEHNGGNIKVTTEADGERAMITIADDGIGIPEDKLSQVFDPFFTTKEVGKGTGLGLSICYGIVMAHNGLISAENNEKGGSTFTVYLPLMGKGRQRTAPLKIE